MCPLRFILVFLSAALAGYFAWKNMWAVDLDEEEHKQEQIEAKESSSLLHKVCSKTSACFWTFVDMASGRYLWQNFVAKQRHSS